LTVPNSRTVESALLRYHDFMAESPTEFFKRHLPKKPVSKKAGETPKSVFRLAVQAALQRRAGLAAVIVANPPH
jgi:hypothetical protein